MKAQLKYTYYLLLIIFYDSMKSMYMKSMYMKSRYMKSMIL